MAIQYQKKIFLLYNLSMIAFLCYLTGFFPVENSFKSNDYEPLKLNYTYLSLKSKVLFDKLVLMVIDALRYDFVFPEKGEKTEKSELFITSSILNKKSCLVRARAQAPTVTMPRLKAMTSGIIPTYLDVVTNFMSSELKLDNFIKQAVLKNFKIVFYGDDTWIKLFPNTFMRSEGTTSFFASDYTEVDNNITRHLDREFRKKDWDFLILHYLGLDHIGHMEGPKSSLIKPKLKEMDMIIQKITQYLEKMERDGTKSLFIVTSDHGMKDSGSHGGVSRPEIILPLVSVGKPCHHIPGWPTDYTAEQIDLPSTISVAFGLPIPNHNIGKVIPSLLSGMDEGDIIRVLELNKIFLKHRSGMKSEDGPSPVVLATDSMSYESLEKIVRKYFNELNYLSENLRTVSEFKLNYLIFGVICMWIVLFMLLSNVQYKNIMPKKPTQYILLIGTIMYGISLTSTSMIEEEHQTWYFFWITFLIVALVESINQRSWNILEIRRLIPWVALVISHRILRKLNQTGDKWSMLPDIKGFLTERPLVLFGVYLTGLIALFLCAKSDGCDRYHLVIFGSALAMNFFYRITVLNINTNDFTFLSKTRWCTTVFWGLTVLFTMQVIKNRRSTYLIWALCVSILLKPHNVILLPIEILTSRHISKNYGKAEEVWNTIAHFWMGYVFYFYQGNGNSIANIDVAAGFVGQEEYNPLYSCVMIAIHTNASHVLSFLLSPQLNIIHLILRLIPLTLYCTFLIFQLNHLFIWSVFSPKLLYETNFSLIYFLLTCTTYVFNKVLKADHIKTFE